MGYVWDQVLTDCSELAREKMWARIHLAPVLQAEEDRDQVRRYLADQEREKQLLGKVTKVYNSDRYVTQRPNHRANSTDSSSPHTVLFRTQYKNRFNYTANVLYRPSFSGVSSRGS